MPIRMDMGQGTAVTAVIALRTDTEPRDIETGPASPAVQGVVI